MGPIAAACAPYSRMQYHALQCSRVGSAPSRRGASQLGGRSGSVPTRRRSVSPWTSRVRAKRGRARPGSRVNRGWRVGGKSRGGGLRGFEGEDVHACAVGRTTATCVLAPAPPALSNADLLTKHTKLPVTRPAARASGGRPCPAAARLACSRTTTRGRPCEQGGGAWGGVNGAG